MVRELQTPEGRLVLTEAAIAAVAGAAAIRCDGVAATVARGLHDELAGLWREARESRAPDLRQALERGVEVHVDAEQLRLRLDIAVVFGARIQDVCRRVVTAVARDVQAATGIQPTSVDVRVVAVRRPGNATVAP